jgi:autotransporter translocation and assembly factor TamB
VLRVAGTEWRLTDRARVGYSADGGVAVENLLLRRTGPGGGYLAADGVIPPRGNADFRLHAEGIDLAEARRIFPSLPEISGRLRVDATLNGAVTDPRLTLDTRVDSLRFGGAFADSVHVDRKSVV